MADDARPDDERPDDEPVPVERAHGEQADDEEVVRVTRRNAAAFFAAIGGAAAVGSFAVSALGGLNGAALSGGPTLDYTTIYVQGTRLVDRSGNPLGVDAIPQPDGSEMTVFPEMQGGGALVEKLATTVLVRFDESQYASPTDVAGTVNGYAAYSQVCTHAGCIVSQRAGPNNQYLHCPCHQSSYDPLKGCTVVEGPAPRALPQLPIGLTQSDQLIVATGPFTGPIGPQ